MSQSSTSPITLSSHQQQPKPSDAYSKLQQKFSQLQRVLQKREQTKQQKKRRQQDQTNDLYESIQQKTDSMISRIQELKRKETIIITIHKLEPSIPENFPKNYFLQVTYQDVIITGNQKYIDFDENVIQEKFIIPLLTSSKAKIEIWTSQQQPTLFDKINLQLQKIIEECLLNTDKFEDQLTLNECPQHRLTYRVQLQGIGFGSWLKNLNLLRELETEKQIMKQEDRKNREQSKIKFEQKKKLFHSKFNDKKIEETKEYHNQGIDDILGILAED